MASDDNRRARRAEERCQRQRGERAEHVANWYFRLNGFLSIPGFVVHPDIVRTYPLTEADLIAVRFPHSREVIGRRLMEDDGRLVKLATKGQLLLVLVEVKTNLCDINGPWSDPQRGNMQRVIRRLGFAEEPWIEEIAKAMYRELRWEDEAYVLQYIAVGRRINEGIGRQYPRLLQVTWDDISEFLSERFHHFPEKLPDGRRVHEQWPEFGKAFGEQCRKLDGQRDAKQHAMEFVLRYIDRGTE